MMLSFISSDLIEALEKICGKNHVSVDPINRFAYARDCSTQTVLDLQAGKPLTPPAVVVWPENSAQISQILKLASKHRVPLVPFGGGSGVCGSAIPLKGGILLDLKRLDRILKLDEEALTLTVEPGILGEILERELLRRGYTLGHFPSSIYSATVGGYLACRSAGQLSTKYGKIEDMVIGLKVCLADGRMLEIQSKDLFSLQELFVGSEGCFGVITEVTFKIHPKPEAQKFLGLKFPDVYHGLQAIRKALQAGFRPAVVRLYDPLDSLFFSTHSGPSEISFLKKLGFKTPELFRAFLKSFKASSVRLALSKANYLNQLIELSLSKSLLILGFEGPDWKVRAESEAVLDLCLEYGALNLGEEPGKAWLARRYAMGYKLSPIFDFGAFADTMEVASSWTLLFDLYQNIKRSLSDESLVMAHFSHAYPDGCSIYFTFAGYAGSPEENAKLHRKLWDQALKACLESGATISHHHGVGFLKAKAFVEELGPLYPWLKKTKAELDPALILNPGKLGL